MIEQLKAWDQQLLFWLNGMHTPALDPIMFWLTKTEFWIPLYIALIYLIFRTYKKEGWWVIVGIIVTLLLADMITYRFMKPFFHRLRPSHEPGLQSLLHLVNDYRGGLYGFASSHAANTTGIAFFMYLLFKKSYRWIGLIFLWAFVMSYTRIYLGVHYPGDIIAGALVGIGSGAVGYAVYQWLEKRYPLVKSPLS